MVINGSFFRFIIVGIINTIFGTAIMFVLYNVFHQSYWISSAANYFFGSILSYILNKYFTFKYKGWDVHSVIKFTLNILFCYFVAYGLAQPLVNFVLGNLSQVIRDNVAMAVGMCVFVLLNYFGQRLFVFRRKS